MIIRKKQILAVTLILALGAAVLVNWYYTGPGNKTAAAPAAEAQNNEDGEEELGEARYVLSADVTQTKEEEPYFAEAKLKRQNAHDEASESLQAVIKDGAASPAAVKEASTCLTELAKRMETEAALENAVTAKLGAACLAVLSDEKAQIILPKGSLNGTAAVQVQEIVKSQTGYSAQNITILENNS